MRKQRPSEREETAYHEAGHAVVGTVLGWQVREISIESGADYYGRTDFIEPRQPSGMPYAPGVTWYDPANLPELLVGESVLPDLLARYYAGIVAQRLLREQCGVNTSRIRLGHDLRKARELVRRYDVQRRHELLNTAELRAHGILSLPVHWRAAEIIADRLLREETLSSSALYPDKPTIQQLLAVAFSNTATPFN